MNAVVLRVATGLAQLDRDGVVYVASLPGGPITVLEGTAASIWVHASGHARAEVVEGLAEELGVEISEIEGDVEAFIDTLLERGLLVEERPNPRSV